MPQPPKAIKLGPAPPRPPDAPPETEQQPEREAKAPRPKCDLPQLVGRSCTAQTALALSNQLATEEK
eukprot:7376077-Karenia_brevis.AAC.1